MNVPLWKTLATKVLVKNKFLTVEEHDREEEGTGKRAPFYILHPPDWVNVIAITSAGEIVLTEEFRHGTERVELEIPSGIIESGEPPRDAAVRELREETGYEPTSATEIRELGTVSPNTALMSNTSYTFLITNVRRSATPSFDEMENIAVRLIPRSEVETLIRSGAIRHALILAAFYWLRLVGG